MPLSTLIPLAIAAAWGWIGGLAFRAGHLRRMGQWYFQPALPAIIRHLPLQLVPIGTFLSCIVVVGAIAPDDGELPAVGVVFFRLIFVTVVWWIIVMIWPPRFLKPRWIREREQIRK